MIVFEKKEIITSHLLTEIEAINHEIEANKIVKNGKKTRLEIQDKIEKTLTITEEKVFDVVQNSIEKQAEITDAYYIHNAGLVFLNPFLAPFLRNCGVAKEDKITDASQAIALLEFLASGKTNVSENDLIFNKLLCGIPLEQPIEKIEKIDEKHQQEAEKLLETVIDYWSILGNSSPEGLRHSFLLREGKLSQKSDGDWLLQVQQESYDMLLDDLPWGYTIFKLPFMQTALWVE